MSAALRKLEEDKKKRETLLDQTKSNLEERRKKMEDAIKKEVDKAKKEGVKDKGRDGGLAATSALLTSLLPSFSSFVR